MKRFLLVLMVGVLSCGLGAASARAHFLFIQVGPHAEAGRSVEVFFSERATAGDPKFVAKVAHTELWRQDEPGKFVPLTVNRGTDRLRAFLPSSQSVSVVGRCEYGVLKRDKSFLLRYYPKAVSGKPDDIAKLGRYEQIPLEIMPAFAKDSITLTVLREGKPLANSVLTTIDADLSNEELTTDAAGQATWRPKSPGQYAVYVKHVVPQAGTKDGETYDEIREFATLAFDWPLGESRVDAAAVAMFERAIAARAAWTDFNRFMARVSVFHDDRRSEGMVTVKSDGDVSFHAEPKLDDEAAQEWVRDQLHSLVIHRVPSSGIQSQPVLSFADKDDAHPLGRLLTFHGGRFASTYRIRDDEITVVNRNLGRENMSLQMLESERNAENKVLPRAYQVQYRDAETGAITRIDTFRNRWQRVGKLDLPESLTQTVSSAGGVSVRSLKLHSFKLAQ
ncbi:MAG: DUF3386 family protein [Candidatus Saccharimonas sp.]|nr:DUF3386 family protein [Planctomycetaceae bacterium]